MNIDDEDHIDRAHWLPLGMPIITKERAAKMDIVTGESCTDCDSSGKESSTNRVCPGCKGKGWTGMTNAATVPLNEIKFAQVQIRNILNFLWGIGAITDEHHDAGWIFKAWRDQHDVALGFKKSVSSEMSVSSGTKLRAYGYVLILKRVSRADLKALESAVETIATTHTQVESVKQKITYRRALENLVRVLPPIQEQIASLEVLSEEDRGMLMEERLKNLLQTFR